MGGFAWVTLATNDSYSLGALVLAHSLKRVNTNHQLAVLITPAVSQSMKEQLQTVFDVVKVVDVLDSKDETNLALLKRPELGITFTKIHCWRLTEYEKCVFLDADTLVVRNCDELFEREELSAAPDVGWPDCFNTGVFVYKPSVETFNNLVQLAVDQGSFDGGDQGLLNQYFSDWATQDIKKHLPFVYNLTSVAVYSYIPAFKQYGSQIRIVHFIGTAKPWLQQLDPASRTISPAPGAEHLGPLLQNWWDIFCEKVHPALSRDLECASGMLNLQVSDHSNAIAVETSDEPGPPGFIEPVTPYKERDDSRQINLPYHPFEVKSTSGESLTQSFLQAREQEIVERQMREEEEEERRRREDEERLEQEQQTVMEDNGDESDDGNDEAHQEMVQEEPEVHENIQNEEPPPQEYHQSPFDYHTFYPDETCINTYLEQNVNVYQPFDNQRNVHHEEDYKEPEPEPQTLPRFLTIPEDDPRQGHHWHPPPPPPPEEPHYEPYVPPTIPPTPHHHHHHSQENLHENHEESVVENTELQKSKSMTNLSEPAPPAMTGNFWKSQPNVNVDANRKFVMPKLKPLLPKQSSPEPVRIVESRPKITLYTEFHMSSDYKDPVKLPKDNLGFVERQILKERRKVDSSKKFGALAYPTEPDIPEPSPPRQKYSPLKEIVNLDENIDYDLSSCKRQAGNKPFPQDKPKKYKENTFFLPELKPLVPEDGKRELFKKRKSDERLQIPEDGRRKKKEKKDSRKARERKANKKPAEAYVPTTDVNEILKKLVNYTKDYENYFNEAEEKAAKRKTPSPTIMVNGKEVEGEFSPVEFYDKEYYFKESASEFRIAEPEGDRSQVVTDDDEDDLHSLILKASEAIGALLGAEERVKSTGIRSRQLESAPIEEEYSKIELKTLEKSAEDGSEVGVGASKRGKKTGSTNVQATTEQTSQSICDVGVTVAVGEVGTSKKAEVNPKHAEITQVETEELVGQSAPEQVATETEDVSVIEAEASKDVVNAEAHPINEVETSEEQVGQSTPGTVSTETEVAGVIEGETSKDVENAEVELAEPDTISIEQDNELAPNILPGEVVGTVEADKVEIIKLQTSEDVGNAEIKPAIDNNIKVQPASNAEEHTTDRVSQLMSEIGGSSSTETHVVDTVHVGTPVAAESTEERTELVAESKETEQNSDIAPEVRTKVAVKAAEETESKPESADTNNVESTVADVVKESKDEPRVTDLIKKSKDEPLVKKSKDEPLVNKLKDEPSVIQTEIESHTKTAAATTDEISNSSEPFRQFRSFVKDRIETSQKGLLGIPEILPEGLSSKTFTSGMVISHAIQPEVIPQTLEVETENAPDSDSGVSTDGTEHKSHPSPEDKTWANFADVTKSVAELVLNEPEEPMSEASKPLSYASVAQKTASVPSTSQPRKSVFAAQSPTKHTAKKSSQPRKFKQPSQPKPAPAEPASSGSAPKLKPKKTEKPSTEEVKKPSNIFEVLSDDSPDESVGIPSFSPTKKISKSKQNPKSTASKTTLVPSANLSDAPRVNSAQEDRESEVRLADPNDNSGIAGAIANLSLESEEEPSAASTSAQEEYLRRQNWETGKVDYLGRDSFDNIWSKICETLEKKETDETDAETPDLPSSSSQPTETSNLPSTVSFQQVEEPAVPSSTVREINEYPDRGPVSLSMILNDEPSSEVEYIETLPPDVSDVSGPVSSDEDDIIFVKSGDRHAYLSNIIEETIPEAEEAEEKEGKGEIEEVNKAPERLEALCTGVIENNNKGLEVEEVNDFVLVGKVSGDGESSQKVGEGVTGLEEKLAEPEAAQEKVTEEAGDKQAAQTEIKTEPQSAQVTESQNAVEVAEPQVTQETTESQTPQTATEPPVAQKVAEPLVAPETAEPQTAQVSEPQAAEEVTEPRNAQEVAEPQVAQKGTEPEATESQPTEIAAEPQSVQKAAVQETAQVSEPQAAQEVSEAQASQEPYEPQTAQEVTEPQVAQKGTEPEATESQPTEIAAEPQSVQKAADQETPQPVEQQIEQEAEPQVEQVAVEPQEKLPDSQLVQASASSEIQENVAESQIGESLAEETAEKQSPEKMISEPQVVAENAIEEKLNEPVNVAEAAELEKIAESRKIIDAQVDSKTKENVAEAQAAQDTLTAQGIAEAPVAQAAEAVIPQALEAPAVKEAEAPVTKEAEAPVTNEVETLATKEAEAPMTKEIETPVTKEIEMLATKVAETPVTKEAGAPVTQVTEPQASDVAETQASQVAETEASQEAEAPAIQEAEAPGTEMTEPQATQVSETQTSQVTEAPVTQLAEAAGTQEAEPQPNEPERRPDSATQTVQSPSSPDSEEKKKAEIISDEKKLEINPAPSNPESCNPGSSNPGPSNPNPGPPNPGPSTFNSNPSESSKKNGKEKEKEKKGVISKILEFVGVSPKQKKSRDESESSKSVFYDDPEKNVVEKKSEVSKSVFYDEHEEPSTPEEPVPVRKSPVPHVPSTLIETSFVSAPENILKGNETIDEILKATDLSSIPDDVPDSSGDEVVQELIQIAEEAGAKLNDSETIESITGKLQLLTDGLKELDTKKEEILPDLSEEETLEISKVVAETFEKIISVLEDPSAYVEKGGEGSESEKKTPIVENPLIDKESLLPDINDILEEAKVYIESQKSHSECLENGSFEEEEMPEECIVSGTLVIGKRREKEEEKPIDNIEKVEGRKGELERPGERFVETKGELVEQFVETTKKSLEQFGETVKKPVEQFVETVTKPVEQFGEEVEKPVEQFVETVEKSVEQFVETIEKPVELFLETTEKPVEQFVETIEKPVEQFVETTKKSVEHFVETIEMPVEQFLENIEKPVEQFVETTEKPVEHFVEKPAESVYKSDDELDEPEFEDSFEHFHEPDEPVYSNVQKIDSKLIISEPPPPPKTPEFEVEEIKVTSEEERQRHKSQPSTSKLSGQILKAIPPPRRKAISEGRGRPTGAIPKTNVNVVLEKKISETMTVEERNPTPPPVPPRRNRSKPRQPPLPPPKRKTKK